MCPCISINAEILTIMYFYDLRRKCTANNCRNSKKLTEQVVDIRPRTQLLICRLLYPSIQNPQKTL